MTPWSATSTAAAFSGVLLVSALTDIPVGRILDRRGPRAVLTTGSLIGVVAVLAIAYAPNLPVFAAAHHGAHRRALPRMAAAVRPGVRPGGTALSRRTDCP